MYRRSSAWPEMTIPRVGTVDDFGLHETKLKPQLEQFCKDRVEWFKGVEELEISSQERFPLGRADD
jgi:hypothetical protein